MKTSLAKAVIFLKRFHFILHFIVFFLAFCLIFFEAIPDIMFNKASDKPIEITLNQLFKTPKEKLPRYLKITDAIVPSDAYILDNDHVGIYYPVYPENQVNADFNMSNLDSLTSLPAEDSVSFKIVEGNDGLSIVRYTKSVGAKLFIYDTYAKEGDLNDSTGHYFDSPTFSIEGRYDGTDIPIYIEKLFKENNVKISNDAILLKRGNTALTNSSAILLIIVASLIGILSILTLVPSHILVSWAKLNEIRR